MLLWLLMHRRHGLSTETRHGVCRQRLLLCRVGAKPMSLDLLLRKKCRSAGGSRHGCRLGIEGRLRQQRRRLEVR
jgi:hypothetical protein